ncbi:MAG: bifunctional [glutamate--ammonia ligase]-adenylyl-L-tyrosine phosphorylase/[glutamate--ammonia-ligase] adenylyltransferase [Rhodanobacteraceae bacterium]|nr:bifunctional [glutamate--ammonia ligase]-adenylyl-L-tyrosine phosphorylase/[glutamate--ammonia-ligase] adenylyltransferase [Rhodanobacteraceae bacterium]
MSHYPPPWQDWLTERRQSLQAADAPAALDAVLLASDFAVEELRRRPALLALIDGREAAELQPPAADDPELSARLRQFRRAESLSIIIDDVLGRDSVERTLERTTVLAERCIEVAFAAARAELVARHGEPRDEDGVVQSLIVYGLGKLGSRELNFSSDIDLIAAFPRAGETDGRRALDNEDFFARLVQRASTLLGETTAEGFGYRVDWRLRPFGTAGRLTLSFDAMEDYYQREGREWERFALLRARPVAGDLAAGRELLERLRPFVWRRYFDYAALEGLRELKAMVDAEVRRREREHDLKLGPGGIREIEFRVQLESIIRGGRDPSLRTGNTLELLTLLAERGVIAADEALALAEAYCYLRRLENRVQMYRDEQTHVLPEDPDVRERYALALNYTSFAALMNDLDYHRTLVSAAFERCLPLASTGPALPAGHAGDVQLWRRFSASAEQNGDRPALPDSPDARALHRLAETPAVRAMSARGRARLDRIVPLVLAACRDGQCSESALEHWVNLLAAVAGRTSYLALLAERPALISRVHRLLVASPWLACALAQSPILLDDLLDQRLATGIPGKVEFAARLEQELAAVDPGDTEHELERVRQFQQSARLELALAFLDGRSDAARTASGLADIADLVIDRLLRFALRDLAAQHGVLPGLNPELGLAVIGYGSLGGRELNFSSDLDLVFVYDEVLQNAESGGARALDGQRYLARAAQRLLHLLTVQTAFGPLYEIDARLRPNGSKGLLVTPLSAYARYQESEAWLWEHQALVRARFVAGDAALGAEFEALRTRTLLRQRDPVAVAQEVSQMRERWREALDRSNSERFDLKQGHGGLVDIEFIAQQQLLAEGHRAQGQESPPTETAALLGWLTGHGLLDTERATAMAEAHRRLLDRGLRCALALESRIVPSAEALSLAWRG